MSIDLRYIDTGHHLRYLVTMRAVYVRRESLGWFASGGGSLILYYVVVVVMNGKGNIVPLPVGGLGVSSS